MILRTELRRSTAPVAGVGLLVGSLALLYSLTGPWIHGSAPWTEEWTGLAQWTRYLTLFLWPLVIGLGAWQGLRDHRSRVTDLFASTPRPAWRRVGPTAAAPAIALTAAYVLLLVVGGVQVAGNTTYFHLKWVPVAAVMVLALVGLSLLGTGIGRLVPSVVTPPVVAVAALAAQVAALQGNWILLTPAFEAPDISAFTIVPVAVTLTQALWFLGIGATGFALLVTTGLRARMLAALPLVVAAAVALPVLPNVDSRAVADVGATALVCDKHGPRVCVTRVHADYLPGLAGPARKALADLGKLPSAPTSVVELDTPAPRRPGPGEVLVFLDPGPLPDPETLRHNVLSSAVEPGCRIEDEDLFATVTAEKIIVMSWLAGRSTPAPEPGYEYQWEVAGDEVRAGWAALMALPPTERAARVGEIREALAECRPIDLDAR